jgi:S-methylmethionine-dependent homocysteine/selenocysteine methylase
MSCSVLTGSGFLLSVSCSYQTTNLPDAAAMQGQYADIARALQPYVDILLAETLSTAAEAKAALAAAAQVTPGRLQLP